MTESEVPEQPVMTTETPQSDELKPPPPPPQKINTANISFSIWPPAQRTRDAVTKRLIETLSTPSVISKRYGTMTAEEAASVAKHIEEEAFAAASGGAGDGSDNPSTDEDGIELLQVYSKEISKRMLETVKSRAAAANQPESVAVAMSKMEVSSSVETEPA